jgi:hypothetical protein
VLPTVHTKDPFPWTEAKISTPQEAFSGVREPLGLMLYCKQGL